MDTNRSRNLFRVALVGAGTFFGFWLNILPIISLILIVPAGIVFGVVVIREKREVDAIYSISLGLLIGGLSLWILPLQLIINGMITGPKIIGWGYAFVLLSLNAIFFLITARISYQISSKKQIKEEGDKDVSVSKDKSA